MAKALIAKVATCAGQFAGYWGYGSSETSSDMLNMAIDRFSKTNWSISSPALTDENITVVSLSAADRQPRQSQSTEERESLADVWVKISHNRLTLGRQAFGRVTLYWLKLERVIWFSSRFQLLLSLVELPKVSLPALYGYSCFSYVPTPLTPIEQIMALAAGTKQTWWCEEVENISFPKIEKLWEWSESEGQIYDEVEAIAQLQILLKDAVTRQIVDLQDQTVGVFLSGGLDSSIVAALLVQAGVKVRAYTLDFGLDSTSEAISEHIYAEQVAQWLNIPIIKVDASPKRIREAVIPTINALDLPFGDGVIVPLFLLNQAASKDTSIVFNGEGGDQLFAGWTNKPLIAASVYQSEHPQAKESFEEQYLRTFHRLWGYESQVFQSDVYQQIQQIQPLDWISNALDSQTTRSLLHRLRRANLMLKGAQNIHPRATNLAFAHGLQVRSPFCDLALAEWTFQLSGELFLQGACEKYILKRAVENWLPSEIVWRQKRGMGVPLTSWCLNDWWRSLGNWLNPHALKLEGRWQPDLVLRTALGDLGGQIQGRRIGEILWLLIIWQLWRSQVLKEPSGRRSWYHPFWLPRLFWIFLNR